MPRAWADPKTQLILRGSLGAAAQRVAAADEERDAARRELNALICEAVDGHEAPDSAVVAILAEHGVKMTRARVWQIARAARD